MFNCHFGQLGERVGGVVCGHHRGIGLLRLCWGWVASFWVDGGVGQVSVGLALVFVWDGAMRGGLVAFFHKFFASIEKIFIFVGWLGTRL